MVHLLRWLKRRRVRSILKHHPIPFELWRRSLRNATLLCDLSSVEKARLRRIATLFLHDKAINGAGAFELRDDMRVVIAAQASLLILQLGMSYYSNWVEVIVYPSAFRVRRDNIDSDGVSSSETDTLSGEAWLRGPVILSWQDVERDLQLPLLGHNVVIHEFAHKLDMLNGRADGLPPLHPQMEIKLWAQALNSAYEALRQQVADHQRTRIDSYGATTPAEFFAVVSEYFFVAPHLLNQYAPQVYRQLATFYRQDPLVRQQRRV